MEPSHDISRFFPHQILCILEAHWEENFFYLASSDHISTCSFVRRYSSFGDASTSYIGLPQWHCFSLSPRRTKLSCTVREVSLLEYLWWPRSTNSIPIRLWTQSKPATKKQQQHIWIFSYRRTSISFRGVLETDELQFRTRESVFNYHKSTWVVAASLLSIFVRASIAANYEQSSSREEQRRHSGIGNQSGTRICKLLTTPEPFFHWSFLSPQQSGYAHSCSLVNFKQRELRVRTNPLKYQDRTVSIFIQIGLRHLAARNISYYFLGAESTKQQSDMHRYV